VNLQNAENGKIRTLFFKFFDQSTVVTGADPQILPKSAPEPPKTGSQWGFNGR